MSAVKSRQETILCYSKHTEHNHPPAVDPFQLPPHRQRQPGRPEALRLATTHRGVVGFQTSRNILRNMGLDLDQKSFYNL